MSNPREQRQTKSDADSTSTASSSAAGLFVHRSGSKPLPLHGNRFVVPNLGFKKKTAKNANNSATILRKTGNQAAFSDHGKGLSGDEDNVADAWICAHCSSKNHTRSRTMCTICKQPRQETSPIAARRGRRQQRVDNEEGQPMPPHASPNHRRISSPGSSRSWSPPPVAQRQTIANPQPAVSAEATVSRDQETVALVNPFDALAFGSAGPSPMRDGNQIARTVSVETVNSSESGQEQVSSLPSTTGYQQQQPPLSQSTLSSQPLRQTTIPPRPPSPAHSTGTSVETPIISNRRQDPFAPPNKANMLRPIESSTSDGESLSATSHSQIFRDEPSHEGDGLSSTFYARQPKNIPDNEGNRRTQSRLQQPSPLQDTDSQPRELPVVPQNPFLTTPQRLNAEKQSATVYSSPDNPFAMLQQSSQSRSPPEHVKPTELSAPRNPFVEFPQQTTAAAAAAHKRVKLKNSGSTSPTASVVVNTVQQPKDVDDDDDDDDDNHQDAEKGCTSQIKVTSNQKSYEKCINVAVLAGGIVLLIVVGFILILFLIGGDSDDESSNKIPLETDVVLTQAPTTLAPPAAAITTTIPTVSPSISTTTATPSVAGGSTSTTLAPTAEFVQIAPPEPWVLDSVRLGEESGTRLGEAVVLAMDGSRLAASDRSNSIQLFDISKGIGLPFLLNHFVAKQNATLLSFDMDSSGSTVAVGWSDGSVIVHSLDAEASEGTWVVQDTIQITDTPVDMMSLSLSGNGNRLVVGVIGPDAITRSAPVQLWAAGNESNPWILADVSIRTGTFDHIHVDLSSDGTMLAIARRLFVGASLQTGFVSVLSVEADRDSLTLSDSGFVATSRHGAHVSLSTNGLRLVISNVASLPGGWAMHIFNTKSKQWTLFPSAVDATQDSDLVTQAVVSGTGLSVAVADEQGKVYLRQQIGSRNSVVWVTTNVTEDGSLQRNAQIGLSRDGKTVAVGQPSYSDDGDDEIGLFQIYRSA